MTKSLRLSAIAGLACLWAAAAVADGPHGRPWGQRPPTGVIHVSAGGENLHLWPYTTSDFETPSDPVNLVFPNADPRAIRQELMRPKGPRTFPFNLPPFGDCQWTDAMGYEQATGALAGPPLELIPGGFFREVRRPVYEGIKASGGAGLLAILGLAEPADPNQNVAIPLGSIPLAPPTTLSDAAVLSTAIDFEPARPGRGAGAAVAAGRSLPVDGLELRGRRHRPLRSPRRLRDPVASGPRLAPAPSDLAAGGAFVSQPREAK
jgi:hypothetical protein